MNLKIRRTLKICLVGLVACLPLGWYVWQFRNCTISSDPNDWASFGSYVGGVYSVIVALLVVYIARDLTKKDEVTARRKKAVEVLYQQIIKVKSDRVDERSVHKIYNLLEDNKLYLSDRLYNEVKNLADYFLEVKGGTSVVDIAREDRVKEHLRMIYNA